ncbi:MAG: hypothetical protein FWF42_00750 [Streptococcaceae bacterium]|nr:hypothetical protein [Streptococcaceae bacterium]MCL2681458.1 hypothetical protein [Streptococcaceae bacterium]MCL2858197.1 hypothetical protein [Streptococcaceae bacterium]
MKNNKSYGLFLSGTLTMFIGFQTILQNLLGDRTLSLVAGIVVMLIGLILAMISGRKKYNKKVRRIL